MSQVRISNSKLNAIGGDVQRLFNLEPKLTLDEIHDLLSQAVLADFVVPVYTTEDGTDEVWVCNMTFEAITTAHENNLFVFPCVYYDGMYNLATSAYSIDSSTFTFFTTLTDSSGVETYYEFEHSSEDTITGIEKGSSEEYALKKYYGDKNLNLGNIDGVPSNTFTESSDWNRAMGTENEIDGDYNDVVGTQNSVNGVFNDLHGTTLEVYGTNNIVYGTSMGSSRALQGNNNLVDATGTTVQGSNNAVSGVAHTVTGSDNIVAGQSATVTGNNNAVFGYNAGTIQGYNNLTIGQFANTDSNSNCNIIGGSYITVHGVNNLLFGEQTSNNSITFPGDSSSTSFNHISGSDNLYGGYGGAINGNQNIVEGNQTFVAGAHNIVSGEHQHVKGSNNIINGQSSGGGFVGDNNIGILGPSSPFYNMGYSSIITNYGSGHNLIRSRLHGQVLDITNADGIDVFGTGLKYTGTSGTYTNPSGKTIIGRWNEDGNDRDDFVFVVGGGTGDDINRKNVFTITKDGYVTCKVSETDDKHKILGSACVVTGLPQTGQENTVYVLEDVDTDGITITGVYVWDDLEATYIAIADAPGAYTAGNGVDISSNTISGNGVDISSNTISAKLKSNQGLGVDSNGLYVDKNSTLEIDSTNKLGVASSIVNQVQASIMHGEASGSVASFVDGGDDMPMKSCKVAIDSTDGVSAVNLVNMSDITNIQQFKGLLNGSYAFVNMGSLTYNIETVPYGVVFTTLISDAKLFSNYATATAICNAYKTVSSSNLSTNDKSISLGLNGQSTLVIFNSDFATYTPEQVATALNGTYLIYELETPTTPTITSAEFNTLLTTFGLDGWIYKIDFVDGSTPLTVHDGEFDFVTGVLKVNDTTPSTTYQLTPTEVKTLLGSNNIFADTGDVVNCYYYTQNARDIADATISLLTNGDNLSY